MLDILASFCEPESKAQRGFQAILTDLPGGQVVVSSNLAAPTISQAKIGLLPSGSRPIFLLWIWAGGWNRGRGSLFSGSEMAVRPQRAVCKAEELGCVIY